MFWKKPLQRFRVTILMKDVRADRRPDTIMTVQLEARGRDDAATQALITADPFAWRDRRYTRAIEVASE